MVCQAKYDSVFRTFMGNVERDGKSLIVNGQKTRVYSYSDATEISRDDCYAEYIIESAGQYLTTERASVHLRNGAKKFIISDPAKDAEAPAFVMGVNNDKYTTDMNVVSNASCTTNCLAPMTTDVSVMDLTAQLKTQATYRDVCVAMENAAMRSVKGIIICTEDPRRLH